MKSLYILAYMMLLFLFVNCSQQKSTQPFLETDIPLFTNHDDVAYRLPSLIETSDGVLVAMVQKRIGPETKGDWSRSDIAIKRSTDGGKTWGPEINPNANYETTVFTGCLVEDKTNNTLIVHFIDFPFVDGSGREGDKWFHDTWLPRGGGHQQIVSNDNGLTWSEPVLKIPERNREGWGGASSFNNNHGVQIQNGPYKGRLVMNARVFKQGVSEKRGKGGIVYSDDHGETWQVGGVAWPDSGQYQSEVCLTEAPAGELYVNYRSHRGFVTGRKRLYHKSNDAGETVTEQGVNDDLQPDNYCNAGLHRYSFDPNYLLLTMPVDEKRRNLSVFLSEDDGQTWPTSKIITHDGGYSDVFVTSDKTIVVMYEPNSHHEGIKIARFNLEWLME